MAEAIAFDCWLSVACWLVNNTFACWLVACSNCASLPVSGLQLLERLGYGEVEVTTMERNLLQG